METKAVLKHKEWAVGMTQKEFEVEFQSRNPRADSIPNVEVWLADDFMPPDYSIENFSPEMCLPEMDGRDREAVLNEKIEEMPPENRAKEVLECACGRKFIAGPSGRRPIGMVSHQRKCKEHLNKK